MKFIAFKEITFTKIVALLFILMFFGLVILSVVCKFIGKLIDISGEMETVGTMTSIILTGYFGKSGYEYYTRNKYTTGGISQMGDRNEGMMI